LLEFSDTFANLFVLLLSLGSVGLSLLGLLVGNLLLGKLIECLLSSLLLGFGFIVLSLEFLALSLDFGFNSFILGFLVSDLELFVLQFQLFLDSIGFILGLLRCIDGSVEFLSEFTFSLSGISSFNFTFDFVNGFVGITNILFKSVKSLDHSSEVLFSLTSLNSSCIRILFQLFVLVMSDFDLILKVTVGFLGPLLSLLEFFLLSLSLLFEVLSGKSFIFLELFFSFLLQSLLFSDLLLGNSLGFLQLFEIIGHILKLILEFSSLSIIDG
jgi:hypothetical protein